MTYSILELSILCYTKEAVVKDRVSSLAGDGESIRNGYADNLYKATHKRVFGTIENSEGRKYKNFFGVGGHFRDFDASVEMENGEEILHIKISGGPAFSVKLSEFQKKIIEDTPDKYGCTSLWSINFKGKFELQNHN